jgi:hypothetical protein
LAAAGVVFPAIANINPHPSSNAEDFMIASH